MVAVVGPLADFDPLSGYLTGELTAQTIGAADVTITLAGPDQFGIAEAARECSTWGWRIEQSMGTSDELGESLDLLIPVLDC